MALKGAYNVSADESIVQAAPATVREFYRSFLIKLPRNAREIKTNYNARGKRKIK